jgi:arsenate reductase
LPAKRFFNTSGLLYKALGLKDKLPAMSEEECLMSLNAGGMLVKRPILVARDYRIIGFKETEWADKLLRA